MEKLPSSLVEYGFRRAFITLTAIVCTILPVMNISNVYVALSDIKGNFSVPLDEASWVSTVYALAIIAIMPVSSWLSWLLGRRNYFFMTALLFTVCSFFCGNATGIHELMIYRFLLGLGGGGMLVLSHTIVTESWPVEKRATSQAFFLLGIIAGGTIGSPVAAYMVDYYSWPFIFYVNIPIGIIACTLILIVVENRSEKMRENWADIITLTAGASALYIMFARGQQEEWFNSRLIVVLSQIGIVGIALFVRIQLVSISLPGETRLLLNKNLRTGLILTLLTSIGLVASSNTMASLPGWGQLSSINPLWMALCVIVVITMVAVALIERGGALKYVIAAGLLCFTIHYFMLYMTESGDVDLVYMNILFMTRNLAFALLTVSISTLVLSNLEGKQIIQGVVLYNIVEQLSGTMGSALVSFSSYAGYSRYILILAVGGAFLVCIPIVLSRVENGAGRGGKEQDLKVL